MYIQIILSCREREREWEREREKEREREQKARGEKKLPQFSFFTLNIMMKYNILGQYSDSLHVEVISDG